MRRKVEGNTVIWYFIADFDAIPVKVYLDKEKQGLEAALREHCDSLRSIEAKLAYVSEQLWGESEPPSFCNAEALLRHQKSLKSYLKQKQLKIRQLKVVLRDFNKRPKEEKSSAKIRKKR